MDLSSGDNDSNTSTERRVSSGVCICLFSFSVCWPNSTASQSIDR